MRISDWSSDVCSSDLRRVEQRLRHGPATEAVALIGIVLGENGELLGRILEAGELQARVEGSARSTVVAQGGGVGGGEVGTDAGAAVIAHDPHERSEEHTSELQSLMRSSYAVFCLKK